MIKLEDLIFESEEGDYNPDLWDDWHEYLKHNEYGFEKIDISKLISKFDLTNESKLKGNILVLRGESDVAYLEYDSSGDTFDFISDINDWVYSQSDSDMERVLGMSADFIYNGHIEGTLDDMSENPGLVYHYTTEEKWQLIQQSGQLNGSSGTGISNRWSYGIFTSTDPEEYATGTYGDVCLKIDLDSFKAGENIPKLTLEYEPDVSDHLLREFLIHSLGLNIETEIESGSGMSPYTIIVRHVIPIKYINVV